MCKISMILQQCCLLGCEQPWAVCMSLCNIYVVCFNDMVVVLFLRSVCLGHNYVCEDNCWVLSV